MIRLDRAYFCVDCDTVFDGRDVSEKRSAGLCCPHCLSETVCPLTYWLNPHIPAFRPGVEPDQPWAIRTIKGNQG